MVNYWLSLALFYSRDRTDPDKSYIVLDRWNILWPLPTENLFYFLTHSGAIFCSFFFFLSKVFSPQLTVHFRWSSLHIIYPPGTILLRSLLQDVNNKDSLTLELIICTMEHFKQLEWYWKYKLQTSEGSDPLTHWSCKYFRVHQIL